MGNYDKEIISKQKTHKHIYSFVIISILLLIFISGIIGYALGKGEAGIRSLQNQQAIPKVSAIPTVQPMQIYIPSPTPIPSKFPFCHAQNLDVSFGLGSAATGGDLFGGITYKNVGSSPCILYGQPDIQIFDYQNNNFFLQFIKPITCHQGDECTPFLDNFQSLLLQPKNSIKDKTIISTPIEWHDQNLYGGCPEILTPSTPLRIQITLPDNGGQLSTLITATEDKRKFLLGICNPYLVYPFSSNF
jgi:hypothetical protein